MHWVYHPEKAAMIVTPAEYPVYLKDGWYDSPVEVIKEPVIEPVINNIPEPIVLHEALEEKPVEKKMGRSPKAKAENDTE